MADFENELRELINKHSKENGSDTPGYILCEYLTDCLIAFNKATNDRNHFYRKERLQRFRDEETPEPPEEKDEDGNWSGTSGPWM